MAIAYASVKKAVTGGVRMNVVDVTLDGSYAAGGYALAAASLGVATIHMIVATVITAEGVQAQYVLSTGKLKLFKTGSTTTVTSGNGDYKELATNDSLVSTSTVVRLLVVGDGPTG